MSPETPLVKISDVWILALAAAGGTPKESKNVDALTPYAIPSAPSIICAIKPAIMNK
jgi:hypothetical protein